MRQLCGGLLVGVLAAVAGAVGGCEHVKGVVEESPGRPSSTAIISVGRPGGIAVYSQHPVDAKGHFDFTLWMGDEDDVYLYDGRGDPQSTLRRLDPTEFSDNMHLTVPAGRKSDMSPEEIEKMRETGN